MSSQKRLWDHVIDQKGSFKPKNRCMIPLLPDVQKEVLEFVNEQLANGYICPSKLEQTSLVFLMTKKDSWKWIVQDYPYLNEHTVQNNYLLPLISQLINKLKDSCYFMKIDLWWRYNNVHIKEGDEWKATLICHCRSYELTVTFFGLCKSYLKSGTITQTYSGSWSGRILITVKPNGHSIFLGSLSNGPTRPGQPWTKQTLWLTKKIMPLELKETTKV